MSYERCGYCGGSGQGEMPGSSCVDCSGSGEQWREPPRKARPSCACGCGRKTGLIKHHAVTRQVLRRQARSEGMNGWMQRYKSLVTDHTNLVFMAPICHQNHHARSSTLPLRRLPDSVFAFAADVLGYGPAHVYLARTYSGTDPRLDALIQEVPDDRHAA